MPDPTPPVRRTLSTPDDTPSPADSVPNSAAGAPPAPLRLEPGARPVPEYELVGKLGEGGFGQVWKARDAAGYEVALKFLRLDLRTGAAELRALEVIKNVRHAHVLPLFREWRTDGWLILALELADTTLYHRLHAAEQQGLQGIPQAELLEYLREAAKGLDYLHEKGIQHRDVKPQNLLLVGGSVKVADFGLTKLLERSLASSSGSMTPAYAAPEVFKGQTSQHADQYALAVSYCQLRGGRLPFAGGVQQLMFGHLSGQPDLTMLPAAERPAVARALAKEPRDRWPDCRALADALIVAAGPPSPALRQTPSTRFDPATATHRPRSRARRVALALLLLALVGGAVVGYLSHAKRSDDQVAGGGRGANTPPAPPTGGKPKEPPPPTAGRDLAPPAVESKPEPTPKLPGPAPVVPKPKPPVPNPGPVESKPPTPPVMPAPELKPTEIKSEALPPVPAPLPAEPRPKPQEPVGSLRLQSVEDVTLPAGLAVRVPVAVRREHCPGPVTLDLDGLPDAVKGTPGRIPDREDKTTFTLKADGDANTTTRELTLTARAGEVRTSTTFTVRVRTRSTNSVDMQLVRIPAGKFLMGSPEDEEERSKDEGPQHEVRITKAFYLGATEVTQAQWKAVMGQDNNPSKFKGDDRPVESVSWEDSVAFCKKLSEREGKRYELPTEAEWEYACRAGTKTPFSFGDTISTDQANYDGNYTYEGVKGTYREETTPAGRFPANVWELHDTHGNVWEWCQDWYDEDYYGKGDTTDPKGNSSGKDRVLRGGSWSNRPGYCRSAHRDRVAPATRDSRVGFRVALRLD